MLNYIKAELYRNFNRSYFWVYTIVIAALSLGLNMLMKVTAAQDVTLAFLFEIILQALFLPVFLVAAFIETTTAEESKNLTLKNAIAFGIPRPKIALSKVIVTVVLSAVAAVIIFTVFFGSGFILFGIGEGSGKMIGIASIRILTALPLWIGAISVGTFIAIVINNSTAAAFVYAGAFTVISAALNLLQLLVSDKIAYVSEYLITSQLASLKAPELANAALLKAAGIGIGYTILFTCLSMLYIRRKEIR